MYIKDDIIERDLALLFPELEARMSVQEPKRGCLGGGVGAVNW